MKRELEQKAKALKEDNPNEAVVIYRQIWDNFNDEFNSWDALFSLQTMRKTVNPDIEWANELAIKYEDDKVKNLYGWLVFDNCIKSKDRNLLIQNEHLIIKMVSVVTQKNLREDVTYPCPVSIGVLKLCEAHAENLFNARKVNELLDLLDKDLLSNQPKTVETETRGEIEMQSDLEKYYALRTKAYLKLEEYEKCKQLCESGLNELTDFHFNNDLWFKMRIALSEEHLGNHNKSEVLFKELLTSRAGNDKWFLYRDIAEVYYEQKQYEKAMKYAVDAAFYGNEAHYLIGLYLLQARLLFKLNKPDEARNLAELIAAILKEQNWNERQEHTKLIDYFGIDRNTVRTVKEIIKDLNPYWLKVRYTDKELLKGKIISIHPNGKKGRIKNNKGAIIDFNKKNLVQRIKSLDMLKGVFVQYYEMDSFDGTKIAEQILINEQEKTSINSPTLLGKSFYGTISGITDFGIFVKFNNEKGLIHKNSLNATLKINYQEQFKNGQTIKVIIDKITDKGFSLKYADN